MADRHAELLDMANVGPAVVRHLARVGVTKPGDLVDRDPYEMYERLCDRDGRRHDPCLLDTFISVVDQAGGGEPRPWWTYTAERKRRLAVPFARRSASKSRH
ncbi:helix-hairpin-helix domain-containing protein [Streptodolium elevatio]|uniref:Helix-hairpin-helix domain-containing protein n=1 Tax=Streptodolium elevatio TaxID=3157996 RepID=A0ABV3DU50_9ACTN